MGMSENCKQVSLISLSVGASVSAFNELDSGNVLYDLDVDHVAINDGDPLVLPVTQRVIIHSGLIAIVGRVSCVHWIRIVIIDQIYGHAHYDVAPADIIIPSPAKSRGKANCDQPVAVRMRAPKIASPPVATMAEPTPAAAVKMVRTDLTMSGPLAARYLA
jgi:hypothetical protein